MTHLHNIIFTGISTGSIIGIAVGVTAVVVLFGVIMAIVIIVMARKSHRNRQQPSTDETVRIQ